MTRKDYVAIAAQLKFARTIAQNESNRLTVEDIALRLAAHLAIDNPRFDRSRFLKACGVQL